MDFSGSMEVATSEELEAADCPIKEQDNSAPTQKYSDGGYGWVVLASCFITTGLTSSFVRSFGIFFLDIQKYFETLAFKVSWINAITVAVFHLSCLGNGFAWISSVSLINQYFTDRRPLANALSSAGECVFLFILTPFHQWLIDSMSWQQALMIISGIHLNICVCGALMRPYHLQKKCQNSASSFAATFRKDSCCKSLEHEKISASFIDLTLLKQPKFICMIFFGVFSVLGLFIPLIYLVPHAQDIGIEDLKAALLMSCWSVADLIGRLGCGWFANLRLLKSIRLAVIMTTALSVILLLFPLAKNYTSLVIFSCVCGFFVGTTMALLVTLITDVLGANKLSSALGLIMFFRTIGCLIGPPLAGLLVDWTGVYSTTFFLAGGGMLIASCFLIPIDYYLTCGQNSIQDTGREMETFISQGQSQEEAEKEKLGSDRTEDSASELTNAVSE
ncbi:monocarboxylate transporter 2 isoform X4 [Pristis pectinata]|uniref:monocarboxylate transporter 2 isoform X4 n=1 Tax=Pristis pectinata TaxID=685728 RepID=UPI00223E14AC|nr:monocarboxylate transporter 2 isoform X4 [Pristis pectinata]